MSGKYFFALALVFAFVSDEAFSADGGFSDDVESAVLGPQGTMTENWTASDMELGPDSSWSVTRDKSEGNSAYRVNRNSNRDGAAYLSNGYSLPGAWTLEVDLKWEGRIGLDDRNGGMFGIRLGDQLGGAPTGSAITIVLDRKTFDHSEPGIVIAISAGSSSEPTRSEALVGDTTSYHLKIERAAGSDELIVTVTDGLGGKVSLTSIPLLRIDELTVPALYAYGVAATFDNFTITVPDTTEKK